MYQKNQNGRWRMRASFPITPEQIMGLNVICEKTGLSFAAVCARGVDKILADYVEHGAFVYPDRTPTVPESLQPG